MRLSESCQDESEPDMQTENDGEDLTFHPEREVNRADVPSGVDRRTFMMRSAVIGAAAVITGCSKSEPGMAAAAVAPPPPLPSTPLSAELNVVKKAKGPVMTTLEEFYKVGPGPSSSHTIGPMRITYNFYQRCTKLPADQLAKATAIKVHLFGSLSATGKGHGTERAALAGVIGKEPATVEPEFLDSLASNPDQTFPVKLGDKTLTVSLKDVVYDAPKGDFPHPNTMTCRLMAGNDTLLEQEYYSVGGGFIEWKGYEPPKKGQPKYPYSTMKELQQHAIANKLSFAQVVMANEVSVSGKSEAEVNAFLDKISTAMVNIVKSGLTAPTGGSAGVIPALVYAIGEGGRKLPQDKIRSGLLAGAAVGYLCKHNATLAGAEGGCQAEIGVASAMGAALLAQAHDFDHQVVANAAESSLEHHLGMTCDPVAGFVQVPCIERCAFGAVKSWTGFMIASNEIPAHRRVDFDTTVEAMALTAKEMNSKYKETSEGGLAVSLVLC
jgi:L-serine dehydratase